MRRLLLIAAVVLGFSLGAVPVYAGGAFTQTAHINTLSDVIPVACTGPFTGAVMNNATGNGVMHLTVNGTGDWFTATFEGQDTLTEGGFGGVDANGHFVFVPNGGPTFQGHMMEWFGSEDNLQNNVQHATFNFTGTNVANPSQALAIHAAFDVTVNANGTITVSNFTVSCR